MGLPERRAVQAKAKTVLHNMSDVLPANRTPHIHHGCLLRQHQEVPTVLWLRHQAVQKDSAAQALGFFEDSSSPETFRWQASY